MKSYIYSGTLQHKRSRPKVHDFRYEVALFYLDVDEIESIFNIPFLFSTRGPSLISFRRRDYLKGDPEFKKSLKESVRDLILEKTGQNFTGAVRMLTQVRYLGYCFNPVTFYYCFDERQKLKFIISEITNTPWKERYSYVHEIKDQDALHSFKFKKDFHVSPFLPMNLHYLWKFNAPKPEVKDSRILVHMEDWDESTGEMVFEAHLVVKAKPLSHPSLFLTLLKFPLLTFKTILAIYYQALLLKLKGAHFYTHPNIGEKS